MAQPLIVRSAHGALTENWGTAVPRVIKYVRVSLYGRTVRRIEQDTIAGVAFQRLSGHLTLTEQDCKDLTALGVILQDVTAQIAAQDL